VGADRSARQILEVRGCKVESHPPLATLFQLDMAPFREHVEHDVATRLLGSDDGVPYSVLITAPDHSGAQSPGDERMLLHARPRLVLISCPGIHAAEEQGLRGLPPRLLRRTQEYINAHLDSALNIEALAASAGLSVSHFSRSFVSSVGMTPHNYVMRRRVLRAQQLLSETDMGLVDIALSTGFSDQSHFCRRFRQLAGLSPKAFRARHR
jgi:AraC-like DNA-binding protein